MRALVLALLLASSAWAGEECTQDGRHWVRRDQLDPTLASTCHDEHFRRDLIAYSALHSVALVATEKALRQPERFREGNGLMCSRASRIGTSIVLPVAFAWAARQSEREGHPGRAKWLRVFGVSLMAADAVWDVRQVTK